MSEERFFDSSFIPESRNTKKRSLRQMKYGYAYQKNIRDCLNKADALGIIPVSTLPPTWDFPSDHFPIGIALHTFSLLTWNLSLSHRLFHLLQEEREALLLRWIIPMLQHPQVPKHLFLLQDSSAHLLERLIRLLPPRYTLEYTSPELAIIYDDTFFLLKNTYMQSNRLQIIHLQNKKTLYTVWNIHETAHEPITSSWVRNNPISIAKNEHLLLCGTIYGTPAEVEACFIQRANVVTDSPCFCPGLYPTHLCHEYAQTTDHIYAPKSLYLKTLPSCSVHEQLETYTSITLHRHSKKDIVF